MVRKTAPYKVQTFWMLRDASFAWFVFSYLCMLYIVLVPC